MFLNTEFFLVLIFLYSEISVFSSNAGIYEPEIITYLDNFHAVLGLRVHSQVSVNKLRLKQLGIEARCHFCSVAVSAVTCLLKLGYEPVALTTNNVEVGHGSGYI